MSVKVVWPTGSMALLSQVEASSISHSSESDIYDLYRNCSLAVLNSGSLTDNSKELLDNYENFEINVVRTEYGIKIELINPPQDAIVDGEIVTSLKQHLYAVLRDIVEIKLRRKAIEDIAAHGNENVTPDSGRYATNFIFSILRHAEVLKAGISPNIVICWGGHSISKEEYDYAYEVGYEFGLRSLDICTGCGPGVMEAPMKGAIMGHVLQRTINQCRLIGLTEPSIIAAEPPNSVVSDLVILPDIEKRLEAFARLGHVLVVFPGGPGTAEELLYILSIKMHPNNRHSPIPLILTGRAESKEYFDSLEEFLQNCFGPEVKRFYTVVIDDPEKVAQIAKHSMKTIHDHRSLLHDSFCYNWSLHIPEVLQKPFVVNHANMAALDLHRDQEPWMLAANLRSAFSGIVTGNVKESGVQLVKKEGPFTLHGDADIINDMQKLMDDFIKQKRIMLSAQKYKPCYIFEADK